MCRVFLTQAQNNLSPIQTQYRNQHQINMQQLGRRRGTASTNRSSSSSSSRVTVRCATMIITFTLGVGLLLVALVMTKNILHASSSNEGHFLSLSSISDLPPPANSNSNANPPPAVPAAWQSKNSAVLALASGLGMGDYQRFVGSLRATGFSGHILLGISKQASSDILDYLKKNHVTTHFIEPADQCTHHGSIGNNGKPLDTNNSHEWHCPKNYPDYKISWARFFMYKDWLNECPSCTDGIMLTDARDAFFQAGESNLFLDGGGYTRELETANYIMYVCFLPIKTSHIDIFFYVLLNHKQIHS